jgi:hypothetical protein
MMCSFSLIWLNIQIRWGNLNCYTWEVVIVKMYYAKGRNRHVHVFQKCDTLSWPWSQKRNVTNLECECWFVWLSVRMLSRFCLLSQEGQCGIRLRWHCDRRFKDLCNWHQTNAPNPCSRLQFLYCEILVVVYHMWNHLLNIAEWSVVFCITDFNIWGWTKPLK